MKPSIYKSYDELPLMLNKRRRAESVKNVKRTNGRISLDQRVREVWEEGNEWQD